MQQQLRPVNRHILIVPHFKQKQAEQARGFVLPDSYQQEEKYIAATVLDVASDCTSALRALKLDRDGHPREVVIDRAMVEEVDFKGKKYYIVLENYVAAIVSVK